MFVFVVNKYNFKLNLTNVIRMPQPIKSVSKFESAESFSNTFIRHQINLIHNIMDGATTSFPEVITILLRYGDYENSSYI